MSARPWAPLLLFGLGLLPACLELGGEGSGSGTTGPALDTYGCLESRADGRAAGLSTETSTSTDSSTGTDSSTSSGTTTTGGEPDVITTGTTAPEDFEAMDACTIGQVCATLSHQTGEGSPDHDTTA